MVDELVNPYIAGAPVTEARMFFGREDVFDWIQNSLVGKYADHILVIHGQRRVGKTSVLKQLGNRLPQRYVPVFFDLQGRTHTTLDRFLWWLAREIVRVLKQERGMEIPVPEKDAFSADPEYFESHFLGNLLPMLDSGSLLLTFDEFDNLEESEIKETLARPLIDYLRRLMGRQGLNFIFSIGSSGRKLENMQADYTDFFKTALYKKISFLNEEQTHNLITRPVEGVLEYDRHAVNRIHKVAGGHPYFTQLTCHELFARCQQTDQRHIRENDVEAILDDVVERGTVNLKFVWDEASDIEKWTLASLAVLDKADSRTLNDCLRKQRVRFSESDLTSSLLHLREKDVLTPENRFVIHLLRLWLQKNRPIEQVREELTEVNPIANRYIEIGQEFRNSGQYQKAIESFQEALAVSAGNIQAQVHIALVFMDQKDYDKAVAEFEKALVIDDEDVTARAGLCEAHLALGDAAMQKGRSREAAQSYQRVLAINEEHTEARQRMAEISRQRAEKAWSSGRDEEALSAFTEALRFTPEDPSLIARVEKFRAEKKTKILAILLAASEKEALAKNWDGAVRSLAEAFTLSPDDEIIPKKLADAKAAQAKEAVLSAVYAEAQRAYTGKDYDQAVSLFKKIILEDENYRDASRLLMQAIELRRTAPKWWQRKTPQAARRTPLPRSRPRVSPRKMGLIGAASILVLGLIGGLFWFARNGLPAILVSAADKTPTASPPPTGTPDLRVLNPANQHRYLFVRSGRTWHEARNYCALQGGYLATIQTAAENEFVYRLADDTSGAWLGATDEAEEGVWSWVTGEPWTIKYWDEGEPNNAGGEDARGEDHMVLQMSNGLEYWNDEPRDGPHPFVCEWGSAESVPDPDIHAKLDTIQNTAPIRQINFDAWEFRDSPENAKLENGKLVLLSENQEHVGVSFDVLSSDNFAVEFEFRVTRPGPGGCFFGADNGDESDETRKWFGIGLEPDSWTHLENYVYPDQHPIFAEGSYDDTEPNKVTLMVHGGTSTVFINGILIFDVPNPDGSTFYSRHSFSAEGDNACEFDNYRLWDLSEVDFSSTTTSILTSISDKTPDYEDDFSNLASGWPTNLNSTGNEHGYQDGAYLISTANECNSVGLPTDEVFSDFVLEMDMQFINQEQGTASIFFRNNDTSHYGANISPQGWVTLHKNVSDTHIPLYETVVPEASFQAWNDSKHLTLIAWQDRMAIYVNGQMVIALADPSSSQGQIGFGVCTGDDQSNSLQVLIDNLKIWDLSGVDFSTESITSTPTTSAAQQPAWVTEFAEPVIAYISDRLPEIHDQFLSQSSAWEHVLGNPDLNYQKSVENGEMILTGLMVQNRSFKFHDYVVELTIKPPIRTKEMYGVEFSNGIGDFSGNNIYSCRFLIRNNSATSGVFYSQCLGQQYEKEIALRPTLVFRLIVKGGRIAIYIDDKPLVYYEDDRYRLYRGDAPQFYINAWADTIAISDFKVWNITKVEVP